MSDPNNFVGKNDPHQNVLIKSSTLNLNSVNRLSGAPNDFVISFGNGVLQGEAPDYDHFRMEPLQVSMFRSWPSLAPPDNVVQVIAYTPNTCPHDARHGKLTTYYLNEGYYSMDPTALNYWPGYLQNLMPYLRVGVAPTTQQLMFVQTDPTKATWYRFFFPTWCAYMFGFDIAAQRTLADTPLTSDHPVRMTIENMVLITTDLPLRYGTVVSNLLRSTPPSIKTPIGDDGTIVAFSLDDTKPPFTTITWRNQQQHLYDFKVLNKDIGSIHIRVTDDYARPLKLRHDWTLQVRLDFYKKGPSAIGSDMHTMRNAVSSIRDWVRHGVINTVPLQPPVSSDAPPPQTGGGEEAGEGTAAQQPMDILPPAPETTPLWADFESRLLP